jgi:formamidopyrimidine-DNA glycosylase
VPAPDQAYGQPLLSVGRRGKYLILRFESVSFVIHLMQGGRLLADEKRSAKPRGGQARFSFEPVELPPTDDRPRSLDETALLLTEQGKERRAGVWCIPSSELETSLPLTKLGPEAAGISADGLAERFALNSMRVHGFLRHQGMVAGVGRRLSNEICHAAQISPFATTKKLGPEGAAKVAAAIDHCVAEGLAYERTRNDMSSSKDRPSAVHKRTGEACPVCNDTIREVEYSSYSVNYCPTCQTGGKVLADNTTSKFLK